MSESSSLAMLDIERHFGAPREAVFAALTEPEKMNQWFFGMPEGSAKVEQDFRVGGTYTVNMYAPDGSESKCGDSGESKHAPHGEYLEIDPPNKLVFSWISEGFVDDSKVTVLLEEDGDGTKLILRHELPASIMEPHREGWTNCIDHLEAFLKR